MSAAYNLIEFGPAPAAVLGSFDRLRPSGAPGVSMLALGGPIRRTASGAIELPDPHPNPDHWMHHSPEPAVIDYVTRVILPPLLDAAGFRAPEVVFSQRRYEAIEGGPGVGGTTRHQDNADVNAVLGISRANIQGGVTSIYKSADPDEPALVSAALQPGQCLWFFDRRCWHGASPITAAGPGVGRRDLIVIDILRPLMGHGR
jgi:2OG-Fe dioxygenase